MPGAGAAAAERIEVAAAVIHNERGEFLLAQRPPGKAYAGYWEFPGGKIEPGESAMAALKRELHEELGIDVAAAYPWLTRDFDYSHARVRLRFFQVRRWSGEPHGRESQRFAWQSARNTTVAPLLPANGPILRALELPEVYGVTCAGEIGRDAFMARLERSLEHGLRLVQVREKNLGADALQDFAAAVVERARAHGARVLVNDNQNVAGRAGADGVHLSAARLKAATHRPDCEWCGASCHDATELARARDLGVDFVVLGPVAPTPSHPDAPLLGWLRLEQLIRDYPLPVYAIGGMRVGDLERAWSCGAQGVAMLRGAWTGDRYR